LRIGKDRTVESFEQFFNMIGRPLSDGIEFVRSDMWRPYGQLAIDRALDATHCVVVRLSERCGPARFM
jgi:hypothetical protein